MQLVLYIASIVGALSLLLMMPKRALNLPKVGALLGAATLGGAWLLISRYAAEGQLGGAAAMAYYYVFSFIAIAAAARVITHTRPVYSALWFVMVVLASAGLFLTLSAEFMAFAMVIIYAGAILVTYMFVIMLASQAEDPDFAGGGEGASEYDRVALEPVAAAAAGFLLLAVLLTVAFEPMEPNATAAGLSDEAIAATVFEGGRHTASDTPSDTASVTAAEAAVPRDEAWAERRGVTNVDRVGLNLFTSHPLGLELAGVILLVALVGAVVIARMRVPDEGEAPAGVTADPATGATVRPTHEPGPGEPEAIGAVGGRIGT